MSRINAETFPNSEGLVPLGRLAYDPSEERLVRGDGGLAPMRRRSCQVLAHLMRRRGQVVTKEELHAKVWAGVTVTDDSIIQCIGEIRRAIGDTDRRIITTVSRIGYRIDLPSPLVSKSTLPVVLPRLLVLPLSDLSGAHERGRLRGGVMAEVAAALSRYDVFAVIPAEIGLDRARDPVENAHKVGAQYVLTGSQEKLGASVRVVVSLIEARTQRAIWSERYIGRLGELADFRAVITRSVAASVGYWLSDYPILPDGVPADSAFGCHLRSRRIIQTHTEEGQDEAARLNRKAIDLDPESAYGHIGLAFTHELRAEFGWCPGHREENLVRATTHAEHALTIDPENWTAHFVRANIHYQSGDFEGACARYRSIRHP